MVLNGSNVLSRRCRLHAATWLDERFVAYCRGSERLGGKGSEFIAYLVMTQEDKTTLLTLETMADRKGRSTTIAQRWKARRSVRIAQVKRVTELMCRRQCTADECWRNSLVYISSICVVGLMLHSRMTFGTFIASTRSQTGMNPMANTQRNRMFR